MRGQNVCNSQENGVRTRCAAIENHPAVLKILRVVNLLRVVFLVRRGPLGSRPPERSSLGAYQRERTEVSPEPPGPRLRSAQEARTLPGQFLDTLPSQSLPKGQRAPETSRGTLLKDTVHFQGRFWGHS